MAFVWLFVAVLVDSTDGVLARAVRVHERLPRFPGHKLDDLVDYLTFVFVPAIIVLQANLVTPPLTIPVVAAMLLSSLFGFVSEDAKTDDHFFTGFPSYWNLVAFYLWLAQMPVAVNAAILLALAALVFVPIRYVYPSRTVTLRPLTLGLGAIWGIAFAALIWQLPAPPAWLVWATLVYPAYYLVLSLWLTARRRR